MTQSLLRISAIAFISMLLFSKSAMSVTFPEVPSNISTDYCMGYDGTEFFLMDDTQMWTDYSNGTLQPTRLDNGNFSPWGHFYIYDATNEQWVMSSWTAPYVKINEKFYSNALCTSSIPYSSYFGTSSNYHQYYSDLPTGNLTGYTFDWTIPPAYFPVVPPEISTDYCMGYDGIQFFLMDNTQMWTDYNDGWLQPTRIENGSFAPTGHFYLFNSVTEQWVQSQWTAPHVKINANFYNNSKCTSTVPYSNYFGTSTNYHEYYLDLPYGDLDSYMFDWNNPLAPFPEVPSGISSNYCMGYDGAGFFLMDDTQMWTDYNNGWLQPTRIENGSFAPAGHFYLFDPIAEQWIQSQWTAPHVKLNANFYRNARCTSAVPYSNHFGSSINYHQYYSDLPSGNLYEYIFYFVYDIPAFPNIPSNISTNYCMGYDGSGFFLMDDTQMWTDYNNGWLQPTRIEDGNFAPTGHFYLFNPITEQWIQSQWTAPYVNLNSSFYQNARCTSSIPYSNYFGSSTNYHTYYIDLPSGNLSDYIFEF